MGSLEQSRPFGHAVTFIVALALVVWKCSAYRRPATRRRRVCFVVTTLLSHQLRDGMRLGLWFWPLGSTSPIPYLFYLAMEEALPFAMAKWQVQVTAKQPSTAAMGAQSYELVPVGEELVHDANDNDDDDSDARPDQVRRVTAERSSELIV